MEKKYPSAVDWWIGLVVWGTPLILLVLGFLCLGADRQTALWLIGSGIFSAAIMALFLPCHYTLKEGDLIIRSGVIKKRVPYSSISEIKKSRCPLSAPALSLDRVLIESKVGPALISPINREEFIAELQQRVDAAIQDS